MIKYRVSIEDHSALDEATRSLYIEDGEGFRLETDAGDLEEINGLKSALKKERDNARQARHELDEREASWDEERTKHEADLAAARTAAANDEALRDAEAYRLHSATMKAINETPFRPLPDFFAKVRDKLHLVDGQVRVWDDSGQLPRRNADGSYMTMQAFMREITTDARHKDLWSSILAPPASGSGAPATAGTGSAASGPALPDVNRSRLSALERAKLMKQLGSADYLNLPE